MRALPADLQDALDTGATTLARCWRLERRDGAVLGFTDHDLPITLDEVTYEPDAGLTASALESVTGLAADTHEVTGALQSARITEADIVRGLYDGAEMTLFLVDWRDAARRIVLSRGQIAEIRRGDVAFEAEVTGISDRMNQPFGRAYMHSCQCRLGDGKCGVDLTASAFRGTAEVSVVADPQQFGASGLEAYENGWFTGGLLSWTSGANAGLEAHVKAHLAAGAETVIELWLSPPGLVLPGDTFEISAGCDKTAATCDARYANIENFRGFPHMPGDDVAASYPNGGGQHDGGSLFRST